MLAIARPDLLANLLLLTYSGLDQLIPAIGLALLARRLVGVGPVLAGLLVGEAVVIWLTFGDVYSGHINVGLIALVPNLVVVAVGALLSRTRRSGPGRPVSADARRRRSCRERPTHPPARRPRLRRHRRTAGSRPTW